MYKSPIELIYGEIQTRIDGGILQAVQSVSVSVDKDELMRALAYDRDQYQKGFWEGVESVRRWISVEDEMPHAEYGESDNVLTVDGNGIVKMLYFDGGCWCYPTGETVLYKDPSWRITHWMPLPEPPKEEYR